MQVPLRERRPRMVVAAAHESVAGPVVVIVLLSAFTIYTFGYLRARMHRANSDYKKTKALVPGLRKDFWRAWWAAVKIGFWVVAGGALLIFWAVHDVRHSPAPAATVSVSPSRSTR